MPHIRKLLWYFYKPILLWNSAFTLTCLGLVCYYGGKVAGFVLFFKLMGYASTTFLQSYTAKNVYMFYRNAGYSVRRMYAYTYAMDLTIYFFLLTVCLLLLK
ncbi:hypothetical protein [Mucilaginibacter psychrotolerans]|uniref:ABC transporter permease n=1 Tax=Mucilaginibacter psychrotolerans TaxID=1524096 RepID=A0A4Y8S4G4_9SPHI|nr:hypothetical protein [Mucilaginibacter psychrotolerans]TFF33571.1 hypothetical protein E2R66_25180 [Mucilaginibacter psychrotolerans]